MKKVAMTTMRALGSSPRPVYSTLFRRTGPYVPSQGAGARSTRRRAESIGHGAGSSAADGETPWTFGFQVNERYLSWDDSAARRLIKLVVSQKLNWEMEFVEVKLSELGMLIPDIVGKLECMRADILVQMLEDLPGLTSKLLVMREQLPGVNISSLVTRYPYIILDYDISSFTARMKVMREQLPGVKVELLVDEEPMLLKADLMKVLQNIRRVMPQVDPVSVLVAQPQMVLDMNAAGMLSAADVEGSPLQPTTDV